MTLAAPHPIPPHRGEGAASARPRAFANHTPLWHDAPPLSLWEGLGEGAALQEPQP